VSPIVRRSVVLGLLIAVGALGVDMYSPGFAAIARELHASPAQVQLSMTAYFVAAAGGQLVFGPASDAFGRKRPLYFGLGVFIAGSIWAGFAPSIGSLIGARFLQGLGAAATAVIPVAVISDEHRGPDATRLMTLAMLSLSVSPILAPTLGGALAEVASWRAVFGVLSVAALAAVALVVWGLPETRPASARVVVGPVGMAVIYAGLLRQRRFVVPLMVAASAQSVLLVFIAGSPFVFVTLHGVSPSVYGAIFGCDAAVLIGASQFNAALMRRLGVRRLLAWACGATAVLSVAQAVLVWGGLGSVWGLIGVEVGIFLALGLVGAPAFMTAMEPFAAVGGAAAAIGVALELGVSSAATGVLAGLADGSAGPMVWVMAVAAVACVGFLWVGWEGAGSD
jgi:DHA1 family bicyclomycin/chloramphenicol resistance-like MFS transporter